MNLNDGSFYGGFLKKFKKPIKKHKKGGGRVGRPFFDEVIR